MCFVPTAFERVFLVECQTVFEYFNPLREKIKELGLMSLQTPKLCAV